MSVNTDRVIGFKKGSTFAITAFLTDEQDEPIIVDASDVKSEVRTISGQLIDELTTTLGGSDGEYLLESADTSEYPLGKIELDVKVIKNEEISYTETIILEVERNVTYG